MALVLVVEPDARHAAQLASMARKHLQAEFVTADSAGGAVAALAGRVPDVLLMSPLLSRQDEATVAAWLRDLGPAAAHVQELTIPILAATAAPAPKCRGMLSALRGRRRRSAAPDGCGLDVFARQIAMYMELAAAARKVSEPKPDMEAPEIVAELEIVPAAAGPIEVVVVEDEDRWVPIPLEDVCKEPLSAPEKVWVLVASPPPRPAQDEWGFFDPEQCGFAALVAKLDEITGNNDAEHTSPDTTGRLIAY